MKARLRSLLRGGRDGNQNKERSGASRRSLAFLAKAKAKAKSKQQGGGGGRLLDGVTVGIVEGSGCGGNGHACEDDASSSPIDSRLDGRNLGLQLTRGPDGRVRVQSLTPLSDRTDPTMSGTIRTGDVVLEMAGTNLRRPIDAEGWSRAVAKVKKGTKRPVTFVVAEERRRAAAAAAAAGKETKATTTVPAVEIEVDLANAVSTSMDIRTSNTWEMEQEKTEWVEAEKRQQLEEEKARLVMMGMDTTAANDDSVEMSIEELRRMLDGAASAVVGMFGAGTQGPGEEKKEAEEKVAKEAKASVPPTTTKGGSLSNPIDLDEIPSDLSSIGNGNIGDNNDNDETDTDNNDKDNGESAKKERQMMASAQAEAARAAVWKQAANRSGGNAEGSAAASGNEENGGNTNDNTNDDNDNDEGIVELNRINTAMFERLHQRQQPIAAREITGMSSLGRDRSTAGQSLTGSYTDVSENHMMESFLFLNRDVAAAAAGPDDDIDNDYDEGGKEASKKNGVAIGKRRGNNHDCFEEEEDDYANCNNITCDEHLVNRIDDVVCSGLVCNALPEQLLGNGEGDDSEDENKDET